MSGFCGKTITKGGGTVPKERTAPPPALYTHDRGPSARRVQAGTIPDGRAAPAHRRNRPRWLPAPRSAGRRPVCSSSAAKTAQSAPGAIGSGRAVLPFAVFPCRIFRVRPGAFPAFRREAPPVSCSSRTARRSGTSRSGTAASRPDWTTPRWRRRSPPPWRSWSAPPQ